MFEFEAILLRSPQGIVSLITSFKDLHYFSRRYQLNVADALKFELKLMYVCTFLSSKGGNKGVRGLGGYLMAQTPKIKNKKSGVSTNLFRLPTTAESGLFS